LSCTQTSGARLEGGIRNKAAKGELGRGLPVGLVHGEEDGEVLLHPDKAVAGAIRSVFTRCWRCQPKLAPSWRLEVAPVESWRGAGLPTAWRL